MPILDPMLQYSLISITTKENHSYSSNGIFFKYLKIASQNLRCNLQTVKAHIQFRTDLLNNISTINKAFKCKLSTTANSMIDDYYKFLFKQIFYLNKGTDDNQKHKCIIRYLYFRNRPRLFYCVMAGLQPFNTWFLTDNSVAILVCSNFELLMNNNSDELKECFGLLNLEIDLMAAAGYTLTLIVHCNHNTSNVARDLIQYTLKDHSFSEIHFNLECVDSIEADKMNNYEELLKFLNQNIDSIKGYFYMYRPFFGKNKTCNTIMSDLSTKLFKDIGISRPLHEVFKYMDPINIRPFPFYNNGFAYTKIRVHLSNVPLFDTDDVTNDFTPSCFSELGFGLIEKTAFNKFGKGRVKIFFNNESIKYCNFEDLHIVNPDLYAEDSIFITEDVANALETIEKVVPQKNDFKKQLMENFKEFKREKIDDPDSHVKVLKLIHYIADAIIKLSPYGRKIRLRSNQMFAVVEACNLYYPDNAKTKNISNNANTSLNKALKGYIYQVHTGEGKTLIIQTIAAVLALMGKTVHIATSNILLANRDYHNSYEFFDKLEIKTAVLLHKSELPTFSKDEKETDDDDDDGDIRYKKERFPDIFFGDSLFDNPSDMNIGILGIGKGKKSQTATIIYSTFVNFEAAYLRSMEMNPRVIQKYFDSCTLLIDEADSILIDELSNGTILSRPMNTNGKELLIYVYQSKFQNRKPIDVLQDIKLIWPQCTDITEQDIQAMYKEIELVHSPEFTNGMKYCIEQMDIDHRSNEKIINKVLRNINKVKKTISKAANHAISAPINAIKQSIEKSFNTKKKHRKRKETMSKIDVNASEQIVNDDSSQMHHKTPQPQFQMTFKYGRNQKEKLKDKIQVKYIVPFDYSHKGILEPNKEFNGFVQQFIAIKEMFADPTKQKNMFIKDVSMSYLYASHPIFVKLYSGTCGFTGTIGGQYEKKLFYDNYSLSTVKVPRSKPNLRIDLPILLCRNIRQRNQRITQEIIRFHQRGVPVLVIFQDLNEIASMYNMLKNRGIDNINVFDGRDPSIKPDITAGLEGAISLGTNVCGRGTDIKKAAKPLHVIISYYTSNVRVMQQAYGRTARKGKRGSVHIICLLSQFLSPQRIMGDGNTTDLMKDFDCKNKQQIAFIEHFKESREWIFNPIIKSQTLSPQQIGELRESKINVNRIIAYKYKFPLCLSVDTFLMIQAQKI